ncbi:MAG: 4Fe-4S binding protein [Clostridiales bacterium]|nr:4Fe-4S binding protein [Clostridiales bacterium]MCD7827378.1 4Fe-4S binding protein [Clostridiales bacterium]
MKKVYVNEKWCLGCHLCEYNCAFANSGLNDMAKLKNKVIFPKIRVEENDKICFAVNCRHCDDPICVKSCIAGALSKSKDGVVEIDTDKCVGCFTCVLVCPFGCVLPGEDGVMSKCELCTNNSFGSPACVKGCPNNAIVFEER